MKRAACNNYYAIGVTDWGTCSALVASEPACQGGNGLFNYIDEYGQCDCCVDESDALTNIGEHYSVDMWKNLYDDSQSCDDIERPFIYTCPPGWHTIEGQVGCYSETIIIYDGFICPPGYMLNDEQTACVMDAGFEIRCPEGW
jgi:hypothetical protein